MSFTQPAPKAIRAIKTGETLIVRAHVMLLKGPRIVGRRLICTDANDRFWIADQLPTAMVHVLGPVTLDDALAAAERVLAGRDRSVTGDGLLAVAGLVAQAMPKGEPAPC